MGALATVAKRRVSRRGDAPCLASLVSLLQLSDSALPSGRYTLSHGLEAFAQSGRLPAPSDPAQLLALLSDSIRLGVAPSDGVAAACAHRALRGDATVDLPLLGRADRRLTAVKSARTPREASRRTGRALLSAALAAFGGAPLCELAEHVDSGRIPGNHAVVLGVVSARLAIPRLEAVAGELYAYAAGWVGAAVRLGLSDHLTAQALLHRGRQVIVDSALRALDADVAQISACTPHLDVMSMRHEQAELRLFAT
jgi:urease accessory protein